MSTLEFDEMKKDDLDETLLSNRDLSSSSKLMGLSLVDQGKIKTKDIEKILIYAHKHGLRFGEAAVKLRFISRADLEEAVAAQFNYPYLGKEARGYSKELVAAFRPFSPKGEALRMLRAQLMLRWFSEGRKTLAIMSSHGRAGSSYIAANLAIVCSQLGEQTLLVDADLQSGRQHTLFGITNEVGLSGALIGRASLDSIIKPLPLFRGLSLLPAGAPPPNPGELLERNELAEILDDLRKKYSVILFDAPPLSVGGGAEFIAARCKGALIVLRKNRTPLSTASNLIERVNSLGAEVIGSVLTRF
jgi:chain length determinant protein tyrosine kinase EpsG